MSLRDRELIGELRRQIAQLEQDRARDVETITALKEDNLRLRLAADPRGKILESFRLWDSRPRADKTSRVMLKLPEQAAPPKPPESFLPDIVISQRVGERRQRWEMGSDSAGLNTPQRNVVRASVSEEREERSLLEYVQSAKLSHSVRAHVLRLFRAAVSSFSPLETRRSLASLVGAHTHGWSVPPGNSTQIAEVLQIDDGGFCRWLHSKKSPLISRTGARDEQGRPIYELHLEVLGCEQIPTSGMGPTLS